MRIGIDYDDTLDQAYPLFSALTHALIAAGHEVYIITHILPEWREHRLQQLKDHNIAFTELVISGDKLWECQKRGIEYIWDDRAEYFPGCACAKLQAFRIVQPIKHVYPDGEVIATQRTHLSFTGRLYNKTEFHVVGQDKTGEWLEIDRDATSLKNDMQRCKTVAELMVLWGF